MRRTNTKTKHASRQGGFTLTELIVAVAAVSLITLGVASVFQNTSETIRIGRASAELDTLASAIERVMREDFENINQDGFLVIRNRRIDLPSGQRRRADEMAFFVNGNFSSAQFSNNATGGVGSHVQSRVARVYYGHGVQLGPLIEWPTDPPTAYPTGTLEEALRENALGVSSGRNADPHKWAFLRQPMVLTENITGREWLDSLFRSYEANDIPVTPTPPPLASGLVDIARADMGENTAYVSTQSSSTDPDYFSPNLLTWMGGEETDRQMIMRMAQALPHERASESTPGNWTTPNNWRSSGMSWRGEVVPTGLTRGEMMLTRSTLAVGVSGCAIEWSYNGVTWFGLESPITANTKTPYPYRLMDKQGRPIENGIVIPVNHLTVPDPTGGTPEAYSSTATSLSYRERLFGFGLPSIDYMRDTTPWRGMAGSNAQVRNTEIDPGTGFDPALYDPQIVGAVGSPAHQWYLSNNDLLPDRLVVPLPRLVRVTFTLSDRNGEFTDVPYTFTFEVPQPARLRQTDPALKEVYQDPAGGGV